MRDGAGVGGLLVVISGLDLERLERAATEIREATGAKVTPMRADINTEEGRAAPIAACSDADILVTTTPARRRVGSTTESAPTGRWRSLPTKRLAYRRNSVMPAPTYAAPRPAS
jgi:hypothetical protein